jgi:glyoxylase-like metal-dependent hydrolase (beta-lactamase superfamily II)
MNERMERILTQFSSWPAERPSRAGAVLALLATALLPICGLARGDTLSNKVWIHGSADCAENRDPPLETFQFDADTYILRQNKCVNFEGPFIYLMFGQHTLFIQDTGATADAVQFPLYETVRKLMRQRGAERLKVLVTHSHSHGDHIAGDAQFRGQPGVTLVEPTATAVREHFGFANWPRGEATIDLGGRKLTALPAPGHQDEAIVVYDDRTRWLLTGDSVYPGRLYVRDWASFRASVQRMVTFANSHPVSAIMGTHIELARDGQQYPAGTTYQPNEASLVLTTSDLDELNRLLQQAGAEPKQIATQRFIVWPK